MRRQSRASPSIISRVCRGVYSITAHLHAGHARRLLYSRASPPSVCRGVCAAYLRARRCLYSHVGVVSTVVYVGQAVGSAS